MWVNRGVYRILSFVREVPARSAPNPISCNSGLSWICIGSYRLVAARIYRVLCRMLSCSAREGVPSFVLNTEMFYNFGFTRVSTECYSIVTVRANRGMNRMLAFRNGLSGPVSNIKFSNNSGLIRVCTKWYRLWQRGLSGHISHSLQTKEFNSISQCPQFL
jgi:hypothetical protein